MLDTTTNLTDHAETPLYAAMCEVRERELDLQFHEWDAVELDEIEHQLAHWKCEVTRLTYGFA